MYRAPRRRGMNAPPNHRRAGSGISGVPCLHSSAGTSAPLVWARPRVRSPVKAPRLSVTIRYASGTRNRQTRSPLPCGGSAAAVAALGKPAAVGRKSWALRGCGAAGSASRCQRGGRGFDPRHPHARPSGPTGRGTGFRIQGFPVRIWGGAPRAWPIVGSDVGERRG